MTDAHAHDNHDHGDHAGHSHAPTVTHESERKVFWVMLLTGGFMLAEVIGGLVSGSLALIADAGHMLTDFASLALAWFAFRLSRRPADPQRSYGWHRFEVLAAFVNGLSLFVISAWIVVETVGRLFDPVEVLGSTMLAVAAAGLLVNVVAFWVLTRGSGGTSMCGALPCTSWATCWDRSRPSSRRWSLCGPGGRPSTRSSRRPWSC
jgi:cobalt-zinc-cadmium efflux system protein